MGIVAVSLVVLMVVFLKDKNDEEQETVKPDFLLEMSRLPLRRPRQEAAEYLAGPIGPKGNADCSCRRYRQSRVSRPLFV